MDIKKMDVKKLDINFVPPQVEGVTYRLYQPMELTLEGFPWQSENKQPYFRLPERAKAKLPQAIVDLAECATGGVVRFCSDSRALQLTGAYLPFNPIPHMPLTGQAGFDVYVRENGKDRLLTNFKPQTEDIAGGQYDFVYSCLLPEGMHEYRIYMPLYVGLEKLEIGLEEGSRVEKAPAHRVEKPLLFYGASITQGACASRPSTCQAAMAAAAVDAELINLAFSNNGGCEPEMAELISELDLSCLIVSTRPKVKQPELYENFFKIIREKRPDLPVIFTMYPLVNSEQRESLKKGRDITLRTYMTAKDSGDQKVYFLDGFNVLGDLTPEAASVDRTHPTDLGFYFMAKAIIPVLREALGL
ncbi:MAG: SGNH/GDSL hydrolase N-terminal domain-containing protein [Clostridia bacterium]